MQQYAENLCFRVKTESEAMDAGNGFVSFLQSLSMTISTASSWFTGKSWEAYPNKSVFVVVGRIQKILQLFWRKKLNFMESLSTSRWILFRKKLNIDLSYDPECLFQILWPWWLQHLTQRCNCGPHFPKAKGQRHTPVSPHLPSWNSLDLPVCCGRVMGLGDCPRDSWVLFPFLLFTGIAYLQSLKFCKHQTKCKAAFLCKSSEQRHLTF